MFSDTGFKKKTPTPRRLCPIILTKNRYNRLLANATNAEKDFQRQLHEKERKYHEQLKSGGEALLKLFGGENVCKTQQERIAELQRKAEIKKQEHSDPAAALQFMAEREKVRKERIEKARLLIEKLRPGPRELQRAKAQSEVQRAINLQRKLQHEFDAANRAQDELDKKISKEQIINGLEEAQKQQTERERIAKEYKQELLASIEERHTKRMQKKLKKQREILDERAANAEQLVKRIAMEHEQMDRKSNAIQRDALESLHMSEERTKREEMIAEVEQCKCDIHNEAKSKLDALKLAQGKQRVDKRIKTNEELAKTVAAKLGTSATTDYHGKLDKQLENMKKAFSAEEQARHAKVMALKQSRIEAQQEEQKAAANAKRRTKEKHINDVAQRLENEQIYRDFKAAERKAYLRNLKDLRQVLDEQVQTKAAEDAKPDINYNKNAQIESSKQDKFFFDYATELMTAAKAKGCPLLPFERAVNQYKNLHNIAAETKVPRHLVTKLKFGLRTEGDSQADLEHAKKQATKEEREEQKNTQSILENYEKIKQLAKESRKEEAEKITKILEQTKRKFKK